MSISFDFQTLKNLSLVGRHTDPLTKGLHLWIKPSLQKYWIYRYTLKGRRHNISLGAFPGVSIKEARIKAQKAAIAIADGIDPKKSTTKEPLSQPKARPPTFQEFAEQWISNNEQGWTNKKHAYQWRYTLSNFAYPMIGRKHLDQINETDILNILQPIWNTLTETASRLQGRLERILSAARVQRFREGFNPATWKGHLDTILPSPKLVKRNRGIKHHRAMPFKDLPKFMARLRERGCVAALALEFTILNANRTSEVTLSRWNEIQGDVWVIPAERMKARKEHRVPLCPRSIQILEIARVMSNGEKYIFSPSDKPLSSMAMSMLLKRMKVSDTVHGFRSTFRDWVSEETNHSPEVAEMALAHTIENKVEAAYRRGDLLERRRRLMEDWADYCCSSPTAINLKAA